MPAEVVVYDVATRKVVFTAPAGPSVWPDFDISQPASQVQVLTADQVVAYYSDTFYNGRDIGQIRYVSYDLDTGRRSELSFDEFDDVAVSLPTRTLGWRSRTGDPDNIIRGSTDAYQVRDGVLTVRVFDDSVGHWLVADPVDPVTGGVLRIRAPAGWRTARSCGSSSGSTTASSRWSGWSPRRTGTSATSWSSARWPTSAARWWRRAGRRSCCRGVSSTSSGSVAGQVTPRSALTWSQGIAASPDRDI